MGAGFSPAVPSSLASQPPGPWADWSRGSRPAGALQSFLKKKKTKTKNGRKNGNKASINGKRKQSLREGRGIGNKELRYTTY